MESVSIDPFHITDSSKRISPGNSQNCLYSDVIKMASLLQAARVPLLWALFVSWFLVPSSISRMCTLTKNEYSLEYFA